MNIRQTTNLNSTSSRSDFRSPLLPENDFQIYTKKKVKKILKCLGDQEKIKIKIKKLLEGEEDTELYKKILIASLDSKYEIRQSDYTTPQLSENSVKKQMIHCSPDKTNTGIIPNPNIVIEYSYSPRLLIKNICKIKNTPSPPLEIKRESQNSSESQGICSILNKVFQQKSGENKNKENSYEDAFSDRNLNSHYFIRKEDDSVKNFVDYDYEMDSYMGNGDMKKSDDFEIGKIQNNSNINLIRNLRSNTKRNRNLNKKWTKWSKLSRESREGKSCKSASSSFENMLIEDEKIFSIQKNYFKDNQMILGVNSKDDRDINNFNNINNFHSLDSKQVQSVKESKEIISLNEIKKKYINNSKLSNLYKNEESSLNSSRLESCSINSSLRSTTSRVSRLGMKYNMFSKSEKKFCLDLIKNGKDLKEVSELCEVPLKSLKRWVEVGYERKKGCGRKVKDPELEIKVLEWYNQRVSLGKIPTPKDFVKKALKTTTNRDFLASKGWLEKFRKKHNIILNSRGSNGVKQLNKFSSQKIIKEI